MIDKGEHIIETYAHVLNADISVLKLNYALEKLGYRFRWIDATEFETDFSEILNVPKNNDRPHNIRIGREFKGISEDLRRALVHSASFGQMFMHMEYPGLMLLQKIETYKITGDFDDFIPERTSFRKFHTEVIDLLLQLRLYKIGEIRFSQLFQITSVSRQITSRKHEIAIGSFGDFKVTDEESAELSHSLRAKYEYNSLTELAIKNFTVVYDIPDGHIRFITLMTCLESLFNLGKDQIAHTIARHLALIIAETKEQFQENYASIKKLYNKRNAIVHGGEYKGDIIQDYLDLSDKVRKAINYCNQPDLTKQKLFDELNIKGFE
ncbi:MAG: hypothetical protein JWR50_2680 [Mucilaginibacter sp.]|nr:hypothetical protein [Mucilaginibacter sp.]